MVENKNGSSAKINAQTMDILKSKYFLGILGICVYKFLLNINYLYIVNPIFSYSGFINDNYTGINISAWLLVIISGYFIVKQYDSKNIMSSNILVILYLITYIPTLSLVQFIETDMLFILLYNIYWTLLILFTTKLRNFKIRKFSDKDALMLRIALTIVFSTVIIYISYKYTGFRINLSLLNVYELRAEERLWDLPTIITYLIPAAGSILPILLVVFLKQKKYYLVLFLFFTILLNFSLGGHKSVIFMLLLVFLGYWFYKANRVKLFSWSLSLLALFALIEFKFLGTFMINTFMIRRVLFIPALLNIQYYDFFSTHEHDFFKQSFLRHFGFTSHYEEPIPRIIGANYFENAEANANNGLFADAYTNLGIIGIFLFPFLLAFILKIIDACAKDVDEKLLIVPICVFSLTLASGFLMSALLTNGLLMLIILLLALPKKHTIAKI